jgi:hypothetical protein
MSASEAAAPVEASAQPTRWPPGDVSKNQLSESPQGAGDPRGEFVQFTENFGRVHEGNTGAARKSFRKKVERVVLNALGIRLGFAIPDRLRRSRSTLPGVGSRS